MPTCLKHPRLCARLAATIVVAASLVTFNEATADCKWFKVCDFPPGEPAGVNWTPADCMNGSNSNSSVGPDGCVRFRICATQGCQCPPEPFVATVLVSGETPRSVEAVCHTCFMPQAYYPNVPPCVTSETICSDAGDHQGTAIDVTACAHPDCNENGIPDSEDIDNETSDDCNSNGIPDECDPDGDGDGVPDDCDPCPLDNPDDTDGDGVCDSDDLCPGHDDNVDSDGDGIPDGCDPFTCGNGLCEAGGEVCGAPGDPPPVCIEDCGTCFCGDGVVNQPSEQCDPPDDGLCPGECDPATCQCPGPADDCAGAGPIFDGATPFDTTGANTDGLAHAACEFDGQTYHDIWFQYIATCSGILHVSTCENGGDAFYDTDLVVYDGCFPDDISCPPGDADVLGCNDDDCVAPSGQLYSSRLPDSTGTYDMFVLQDNCYTIRIGGFDPGDQGAGVLGIMCEFVEVCGNDFCGEGEDCCSCQADCGACVCGDGTCDAPCEGFGNCPQDCGEESECTVFTNPYDFEDFMFTHGKALKGVEDFEESTLPPKSVAGMDDPLCPGIPNGPFPNGLEGADNLCVQSNFEHAPATPNPRGLDGLAAASDGYLGAVSDIVLANTFVDSLDLIFAEPKTAIGFGALTFSGGATVDIRVYDFGNLEILSTSSPANASGSFWGVWCPQPIGRVNIFDPGNGAEGGDNITMWVELPCEDDADCNDDDLCTNDSCDLDTGDCTYTPNFDPAAECCDPATGDTMPIDDGDACTDDTCDPATGQVTHVENFDPGTECCDPATGNILPIDDGSVCTEDTCDPETGQVSHVDNFDPATECCDPASGDITSLDDGNACTDDVCDPATGEVSHDENYDPTTECCNPETGDITLIDDGNACTFDACDPGSGQVFHIDSFDPATECCNPATGDIVPIDDSDACTDDVCDPATGQVSHIENFDPATECCDPATGDILPIDDGNACTDDTCDPATGQVSHTLVVCPEGQVCDSETGECVSGCGPCPTDVDGDGATGPFDLAFLLGNWGPVTEGSICLDADDDGIIGAFDLAVVLGAWGPCP